MCIDTPMEMPWDIFGVDLVIDATGVYRSEEDMRRISPAVRRA
jgi:glyceraldehyde 3-phosphate dehydrogenase